MSGKIMRKAGRWMTVGAILGGATMFQSAGTGCSSEDTAAIIALLAAASEASESDTCGCGQQQLPAVQDGTSNTFMFGDGSVRQISKK